MNLDQHFVCLHIRPRHFNQTEGLFFSVLVNKQCFHGSFFRQWIGLNVLAHFSRN